MVYVVLSCGCGCEGATARFFAPCTIAELRKKTEDAAWVRGLWPEVQGPLTVEEFGAVPTGEVPTVDSLAPQDVCDECRAIYPTTTPQVNNAHETWCSLHPSAQQ